MSSLKCCVRESIIKGLSWLSNNQNPDGSFGSIYKITTTALAIRALNNYKEITCDPCSSLIYKYNNQINLALTFLFDNAKINSNDIYFEENDNINMPTGAVLAALVSLNCPNCIVTASNSVLNGYTFDQVINGIINDLVSSQNDDGGWAEASNIYDSTPISSNYTSSHVVDGLSLASTNGYNIPQLLSENLQNWVNSIQNNSGGGGDTSPYEGVNISNTAVLIHQMHFLKYDYNNNKNLNLAKQYITNNWHNPVGYFATGWSDSQNIDYKSCYNIMVAFSLYSIGNLKKSNSTKIIDWFNTIICTLLDDQRLNGSWPKSNILYEQSDEFITTVWSILTLQNAMFYIDCN